ncbi:MAG: diaminobutyrate acetyltransferase [Arcobacteraceae bacterium]
MDSKIILRNPEKNDAKKIVNLIKTGGTLDLNSEYLYLLQCTHFEKSCCVALDNNEIIGFVSGYCVPNNANTLFIWQVAVSSKYRGRNLAARMIMNIQKQLKSQFILSTVSPSNLSSSRVFEKIAKSYETTLTKEVLFEKNDFLNAHEEEVQFYIGPIK